MVRSIDAVPQKIAPEPASAAERLRQALADLLTATHRTLEPRDRERTLPAGRRIAGTPCIGITRTCFAQCANTGAGRFPVSRSGCVRLFGPSRPSSSLCGSRLRSSPLWLITTMLRIARPRRCSPAGSRSWRSCGGGWIPSPLGS